MRNGDLAVATDRLTPNAPPTGGRTREGKTNVSKTSIQRAQKSASEAPPPTVEEMNRWAPPSPPLPWKPELPLPRWRRETALLIIAVAVLSNIAVRVPAASLVMSLLVLAVVGLLATTVRLQSLAQRCAAVLAVGAGALLSFRASAWVELMLLAAIAALVALMASDGLVLGQHRPWLRSFRAGLKALLDALPWLYNGYSVGSGRAAGRGGTWLRSTLLAGTVVVVLGAMLASADPAFGWLISLFDVVGWIGHLFVIAIFMVPVAGLALLAERANPEPVSSDHSVSRYRTESLTVLWAVSVTLAAWCGLQIAVVSGGAESVLADQGITAAEYAREGFFQLVAVAVFCLTVLNTAHRAARTKLVPDSAQRIPAFVIGTALVVLIVVSFSRLWFYVSAFGMTMLRLSVATFLGWLAIMTVLSVARSFGLHHERNWLPSAAVLLAAVFAVGLAAANPERQVAQINLERSTIDNPVDTRYLIRELGPDAKGAVADYAWMRLGGMPEVIVRWLCEDEPSVGYGPLGWNSSRQATPDVTCAAN